MIDHVSVCVCTFHRNEMLARLLRNLALQDSRGGFTFSAVVVDNDPSGPAREGVERLRSETGLEIAYGVEPKKGIPAARNRALRLAKGSHIGIIDDDEIPPPHWLATLYGAIQAYGADGALGPVYPYFETRPPEWLERSGLYDLPHEPTGTFLKWSQCYTGNVLLKKEVFDRQGLRFDETFLTGGSDQDFFRRAMTAGFRFIAVEEAPVHEVVPPERWTKGYFVRRALVNGFNAQKYVAREGRPLKSIAALLKSAAAAVIYAAGAPVCAVLGTHLLVKDLERGAYHLSRVAAAFGIELWRKRDF
jgi:succinoglycan biosynthesis protein ExoM